MATRTERKYECVKDDHKSGPADRAGGICTAVNRWMLGACHGVAEMRNASRAGCTRRGHGNCHACICCRAVHQRIPRLYHISSGCSRAGASAATSPPPPPFLHTYRLIAPVPPHDARCVPPTTPTPHSPRSLNIRVLDHNEDKVFVGRHLKTMHSRVRIR